MDLVTFLRARLDEDEAVANSARLYEVETTSDLESTYPDLDFRSGIWWAVEGKHYDDGLIRLVKAEVTKGDDPTFTGPAPYVVVDDDAPEPVFRHIARHDPARVLREVEAKRRRLLPHKPGPWVRDFEEVWQRCAAHEWVRWPCYTVLIDASVYVDHPDYDPEWKV